MNRLKKIINYPVEVLIVITVSISHALIASTPTYSLLNWFQTDDAFYYYKIAANIAQGLGSTFDNMGQTNGYHPLWMLICIPIFSLSKNDLVFPLRLIVIVQGVLNIGSGILLFRTLKRALSRWLAASLAFFWILAPAIYNLSMTGGLETGINAFFILLLLNQVVKLEEKQKLDVKLLKKALILGVISSLTVLSRLDNIFLVGIVSLWILWKVWKITSKDNTIQKPKNEFFKFILQYSIPIIVLVGSYISWNIIYFGHPMPISGKVKTWWGVLDNTVYGTVPPQSLYKKLHLIFLEPGGPWGFFVKTKDWLSQVLKPLNLQWLLRLRWIIFLGTGLSVLLWKNIKQRIKVLAFIPFFIGILLHSGYYPMVEYVGYRDWYWINEMLIALIIIGIILDSIYTKVYPDKFKSKEILLSSIFGVLFVGIIIYQHFSVITSRYPFYRPPEEQVHFYIHRARWLIENTPENSKIGTPGAGALGYFVTDRTIIPLDGLANNIEYFESLKQGVGADYLSDINMEYVFGASWVQKASPYEDIFAGNLEKIETYQYAPGWPENHLYRFDIIFTSGGQ